MSDPGVRNGLKRSTRTRIYPEFIFNLKYEIVIAKVSYACIVAYESITSVYT